MDRSAEDPLAIELPSITHLTVEFSPELLAEQKHPDADVLWQHFKPRPEASTLQATVLFVILAAFASVGVLIRLELAKLTPKTFISGFNSLLPQVVGCIILGIATSHKLLIHRSWHGALYTGVGTGLCGSITTFSSWNLEASDFLLNWSDNPKGDGDFELKLLSYLLCLGLGLAMAMTSVSIGRHLSYLSPWSDCYRRKNYFIAPSERGGVELLLREARPPTNEQVALYTDGVCISVSIIALLCLVMVTYTTDNKVYLVAIATAPLGCWGRKALARLNAKHKTFPIGTLVANMSGSLVLAVLTVVKLHRCDPTSDWSGALVDGIAAGFCGCLTTVSTFAVELHKLSLPDQYIYGGASLIFSQILILGVLGVNQHV